MKAPDLTRRERMLLITAAIQGALAGVTRAFLTWLLTQ